MAEVKQKSSLSKIVAIKRITICATLVFLIGGCATQPKINVNSFGAPRTVTIVDIPKLKNLALIGVYTTTFDFHFSDKADQFFDFENGTDRVGDVINAADYQRSINGVVTTQILSMPKPPSIATAGAMGAVAGTIGALIQSSAEETQKKAIGFKDELLKRRPDFDLRADFMKSLCSSLEARGIGVTVLHDGQISAPYLRWPAKDDNGKSYRSRSYESSPAVDADILMQVSPIAFYMAPGPLNAYRRNVTVGVALYNGRSKEFIGRQTFKFSAADSKFEYSEYDGLVEHLSEAAPALHDALMSLVPLVTDVVSARSTGTVSSSPSARSNTDVPSASAIAEREQVVPVTTLKPALSALPTQRLSVDEGSGNKIPIQKLEFQPGTSSVSVERLARKYGCEGSAGAGLITDKGPVEVYRMSCDNGAVFLAKCELRQCQQLQ